MFPRELTVDSVPCAQKIMVKNLSANDLKLRLEGTSGVRVQRNLLVNASQSCQVEIEICAKTEQSVSFRNDDRELASVQVTFNEGGHIESANNESMLSSKSRYSLRDSRLRHHESSRGA